MPDLAFCWFTLNLGDNDKSQATTSPAPISRIGGQIGLAERAYGDLKGKWEFPGGKIEAGETPKHVLIREIKEELNTGITVERFFCNVQWGYPTFHLDMDAFICRVKNGQLQIEEGTHMGK